MADPICDVCGQECPPNALRGMNIIAVGREQDEILNPATVRALEDGKRLTICSEYNSEWIWIHPTDPDEPRHRNRDLSNKQVEEIGERLSGWYGGEA